MVVLQGFIMALADSAPGVSGGTIALLMGFFDRLIDSLRALGGGSAASRRAARDFLAVLGIGWGAGMALAMTLLAGLFDRYIYQISSLFLGFVLASIPVVAWKERHTLAAHPRAWALALLGFAAVYLVTASSAQTVFELNIARITPVNGPILFVAAALAASAMILPGISGSSLLMTFGLYLPVVSQIGALLHGDLSALPAVIVFGLGALTGLLFFIRLLKKALAAYRAQTISAALGMMAASLYAIVLGPVTLDVPQSALSAATFSLPFFLLGGALIIAIAVCEARRGHKEQERLCRNV